MRVFSDPLLAVLWFMKVMACAVAFIRAIRVSPESKYRLFASYLLFSIAADVSTFLFYGNWYVYIYVWMTWLLFTTTFFTFVVLEAYYSVAAGIKGFETAGVWLLNIAMAIAIFCGIGSLVLDVHHMGWGVITPRTLVYSRFAFSVFSFFLLLIMLFLKIFQQNPAPNKLLHIRFLCVYSLTLAMWYIVANLKQSSAMRIPTLISMLVVTGLYSIWAYKMKPDGEIKHVPPIMPGEVEALEAERDSILAGLSALTNGVTKSVRSHQK